MKKSRSDAIFDAVNTFLMILVIIIMVYPLYFIVIASVSEPYAVSKGMVKLVPVGFTLEAYTNVFKNQQI